jgi:aspartokinase-like uncharacterized kinase
MNAAPVVVKVGGSLFDWLELGCRLRAWLDHYSVLGTQYSVLSTPMLLVPGGGASTDAVRVFDRTHSLGEETAHWLALQALTLNAHFLAALLPGAVVIQRPAHCSTTWQHGMFPVLDPYAFAVADEGRPGCLPHVWDVTSDSIAVRVADVLAAQQLVLLKSITIPAGIGWSEAGRRGFVDSYFAEVLSRRETAFDVCAVNLRAWAP